MTMVRWDTAISSLRRVRSCGVGAARAGALSSIAGLGVLIGGWLGLSTGVGHAQDALYGKQPPRGSAFVRFANVTPVAATISSDFQAEAHLGTGAADRIAPYTVVERAADRVLQITAKVGGREGRLAYKVAAGGYATIVLEQDAAGAITLVPIVDQAAFNQSRARLAFYNAAPRCPSATLALDPGGTAVFQNVPAGGTQSRTVNPVQATVRAACGGTAGPTLALGGMELGASYSIWLIQPGPEAALFLAPDVAARYQPAG